jgi:hypothetical protein
MEQARDRAAAAVAVAEMLVADHLEAAVSAAAVGRMLEAD